MVWESLFSLGQKIGCTILWNRYDSPVPDLRELEDDLWIKSSKLVGIDMNEKKQLELLSYFESRYKHEYDDIPREKTTIPYQYYLHNGLFVSVDGEILYSMIRHLMPRRIIEIGSGFSTYLLAEAALINIAQNDGHLCDLISIDPYPNPTLKKGFPGLSKLIVTGVERVPLSEFSQLAENDVLFIDSSHVVKTGNDVNYLFLDVLPSLAKGVVVHMHDIFLPAEYPKTLLFDFHVFYTEQYLLQAFLTFNDSFEVLWAGSYMHYAHPDALAQAFSSYSSSRLRIERGVPWIGPASFWIVKVK